MLTHPRRLLFKYANETKDNFEQKYKSFEKFNSIILKNKGFSLKIVKGGEMDLDSCNPYPLYHEETEHLLLESLIQNIK